MEENYLQELRTILETGWSEETAYIKCRTEWSPEKRSLGQCYVTARVLNKIFGWEIMHSKAPDHYWNKCPDGEELDFTSDQFEGGDGIHKIDGYEGKLMRKNYKSTNPRLNKVLAAVEEPLLEFKEKYSDVLAEK